jgi:hypothetical protein
MPADPLAGAHEIQSFCLGHTAFVSCSTFVKQSAEVGALTKRGGRGKGLASLQIMSEEEARCNLCTLLPCVLA